MIFEWDFEQRQGRWETSRERSCWVRWLGRQHIPIHQALQALRGSHLTTVQSLPVTRLL